MVITNGEAYTGRVYLYSGHKEGGPAPKILMVCDDP